MIASRPELSLERTTRLVSANSSTTALPPTTHRHGWLLCSDGARQANSTAFASTSMSTIVLVMVSLPPLYLRPLRRGAPDARVQGPHQLCHWAPWSRPSDHFGQASRIRTISTMGQTMTTYRS